MDSTEHGVVVIIKNPDNKILLLEDNRKPSTGLWSPPHGRINSLDKDETESVEREVFEETRLRVKSLNKLITLPADYKVKSLSFWQAELIKDEKVVLDKNEASSFGWFSLKEIMDLPLKTATKTFFEMVLDRKIKLQ